MSRSKAIRIHKRVDTLLFVEGEDEFYTFLPLVDGVHENVQLAIIGGRNFQSTLNDYRVVPNFRNIQKIGIIMDAEENAQKTERMIQSALDKSQLAVPLQPIQIAEGTPTTAYLILPHGEPAGCLEDTFLASIRANGTLPLNALLPCADAYLACVDNSTKNDRWRSKVLVHSLIASGVENPSSTLSESSKQKMWDWTHPALNIVVKFIREVAEYEVTQ